METWKDLENTVHGLTDERLNEIAVDIYDHKKTGALQEDSLVGEIADILKISVRDVEYYALEEMKDRYKKLVLLLLKERTGDFLVNA